MRTSNEMSQQFPSAADIEVAIQRLDVDVDCVRAESQACGDLLEPLPGTFDLVCANLPYVASGAELPVEVQAQPGVQLRGTVVRDHETRTSIDSAWARSPSARASDTIVGASRSRPALVTR